MVKIVFLLKRKQGMSRDDFIKYYEGNHAPLAAKLMPGVVAYTRSFVDSSNMFAPGHIGGGAQAPDFDVITEVWFKDQDAVERLGEATKGEAGRLLAEDEKNLFDTRPEKMVMFQVDEYVTPKEHLTVP